MRNVFLSLLVVIALNSCGSGGSGEAIDPGLYSGALVYHGDGDSSGGCVDFIKKCFQLSQLQIVQQYEADGTSQLQVVSNNNSEVLGSAGNTASSIDFIEPLQSYAPCGYVGGDVSCMGIRRATVASVSRQDRILSYNGEIESTCSSEAGAFHCSIHEEGDLQG